MPKQVHKIEDFSGGTYTYPEHLGEKGITSRGVVGTKNNITSGSTFIEDEGVFDSSDYDINDYNNYIWNSPIDLADGFTEDEGAYLVSSGDGTSIGARPKDSSTTETIALHTSSTSGKIHFYSDDNILYYSIENPASGDDHANYVGCFPKRGSWLGYTDAEFEAEASSANSYWGEGKNRASLAISDMCYVYKYGPQICLINHAAPCLLAEAMFSVDFDETVQGRYGWSAIYEKGESEIIYKESENPVNFYLRIEYIIVYPYGVFDTERYYRHEKRIIGYRLWFKNTSTLDVLLIADVDFGTGVTILGELKDWEAILYTDLDPGYDIPIPISIARNFESFAYDDFSTTYEDVTGIPISEYSSQVVDYNVFAITGGRKYVIGLDKNLYVSGLGNQDVIIRSIHQVKKIPTGGGSVKYIHIAGDKIYLFKERRLDVLTVLYDDEFGMTFLQGYKTYEGMGILDEKAICLSQLGLIWANESGIYSLEGDAPQLFKSDKLSRAYWNDLGLSAPRIGYCGKTNEIVIADGKTTLLSFDITNDTFYRQGTPFMAYGENTNLFSFPDGDLVSFYRNGVLGTMYHSYRWQKGTYDCLIAQAPSYFKTPYLYLGNADKDKKFYAIKIGNGGGELQNVDDNIVLKAFIYDTSGSQVGEYSKSMNLNALPPLLEFNLDSSNLDSGGRKGKSIRFELEYNPDTEVIIDDISIIYREIGSKTKKTKKIEDFANSKWELSNEVSESGVMCTGFIPYKNYIVPGGNWIPYYSDDPHGAGAHDDMCKRLTWGHDARLGHGLGLIPVSKSPINGADLDDDLLVDFDEYAKRLRLAQIRGTMTISHNEYIDEISSSGYPTNITNSYGYFTFSQNGNDIYWARSRGSAGQDRMGLLSYIKRPDGWLEDVANNVDYSEENSGLYFGSPIFNAKDWGVSAFGGVWWGFYLHPSRTYDDDAIAMVRFAEAAQDEDISGYYGYSIVHDGGETEIIYFSSPMPWYTELTRVRVYNPATRPPIRMTGYNFWFNKEGGDTVLVVAVDFARGVSHDHGATWVPFEKDETPKQTSIADLYGKEDMLYEDYTAVTYESLYGKEISYLNSHAIDYKYSQISGNRRYAIGIDNKLYISRENQIDVLNDKLNDVAGVPVGGGASIALHVESGTVYLFREDALVVLTVEAAEEMGVMRVSDSQIYAGMGVMCPAGLCKTPKGIAWANDYGFFMMEDSKPKNMIIDKISQEKWSSFSGRDITYTGYSGTTNEIVIWGPGESQYKYQFYVYNLDAESFYFIDTSFKPDNVYSADYCDPCSFHTLTDGTLVGTFRGNSDTAAPRKLMLNKWAPLAATSAEGSVIVPPQNCGTPEREKKFYEAIVSYVGSFQSDATVISRVYGLGPSVTGGKSAEIEHKTYNITSGSEIVLDLTSISRGYAMGLDINIQPDADFAITGIEITYREMEV